MVITPTAESQEAMQAKTQAVPPVERGGGTGHGIPSGGSKGQVLAKESSTDYDADWITPAEKFAQTPVPFFHFTLDSITLPTDDTPVVITEGIATTCENFVINEIDVIEWLKEYAASERPTGVQVPATGSIQETVPSNPAVGLFNCLTGFIDYNPFFGLTFNSVMIPANNENALYKVKAIVLKSEEVFTCTSLTIQKIKTGSASSPYMKVPKLVFTYTNPNSTPIEWPNASVPSALPGKVDISSEGMAVTTELETLSDITDQLQAMSLGTSDVLPVSFSLADATEGATNNARFNCPFAYVRKQLNLFQNPYYTIEGVAHADYNGSVGSYKTYNFKFTIFINNGVWAASVLISSVGETLT